MQDLSTENDFLRVYRAATKPQDQKEIELKTEEFLLSVNAAGGGEQSTGSTTEVHVFVDGVLKTGQISISDLQDV